MTVAGGLIGEGQEIHAGEEGGIGQFDRYHRPPAGPSSKGHCGVVAMAVETGARAGSFHHFRDRVFVRSRPLSRSCNSAAVSSTVVSPGYITLRHLPPAGGRLPSPAFPPPPASGHRPSAPGCSAFLSWLRPLIAFFLIFRVQFYRFRSLSAAAMNFPKLQGFSWRFLLRLLDQLHYAIDGDHIASTAQKVFFRTDYPGF